MSHLTMQQLEDLGFHVMKSYVHDDFLTQVRQKGIMTIETTWKKTGEFVSQEISFDDGFIKLSPDKIIQLDKIVNQE